MDTMKVWDFHVWMNQQLLTDPHLVELQDELHYRSHYCTPPTWGGRVFPKTTHKVPDERAGLPCNLASQVRTA